eukprot:contig_31297_g7638
MAGAPVVVLVREAHSIEDGAEDAALAGWTSACLGMAVVTPVDVREADLLRSAVDAVLARDVVAAGLSPVLIVLRAPTDSTLTAAVAGLAEVAAHHRSRLHVEGPALALLMQPEPPVDAVAVRAAASSFALQPAAWLGVAAAAVASVHATGLAQEGGGNADEAVFGTVSRAGVTDSASAAIAMAVVDAEADADAVARLAPVLALWLMLTRLGVAQVRGLVHDAGARAAQLLAVLGGRSNLSARSVGAGGNVLISYELSRVDRMMRRYKAREHVSRINTALLTELNAAVGTATRPPGGAPPGSSLAPVNGSSTLLAAAADADALSTLHLERVEKGGQAYIVFTPVRLLTHGRLYVPSAATPGRVGACLASAALKYEAASVGAAPFATATGCCPDICLLGEADPGAAVTVLSLGAFRVVPAEMADGWAGRPGDRRTVESLNAAMTSELGLAVLSVRRQEYRRQAAGGAAAAARSPAASGTVAGVAGSIPGVASLPRNPPDGGPVVDGVDSGDDEDENDLADGEDLEAHLLEEVPFDCFLHTDLSGVATFLSMETAGDQKPVGALRTAEFAAAVAVRAVNKVVRRWRAAVAGG